MERNSPTSRPAQKLMSKLTPFRKRQLRDEAKSVSETSTMVTSEKERPEHQWSIWPISSGSIQQLSDSAPPVSKNLPSYTPSPVPDRTSSNREAIVYKQQMARQIHVRPDQALPKKPKADADEDNVSIGIGSTFDDDLIRAPQTPISPMLPPKVLMAAPLVVESPVLGRLSSNGSQPAIKQLPERPRGRSKQPTASDSAAKESTIEAPSHSGSRMLSPPASVASYSTFNLHAPLKLGAEALAQLQTPSPDKSDVLYTELMADDDPNSWDVINPNTKSVEEWDRQLYSLEKRAEQLYSEEHLHIILEDKEFHSKFSTFLRKYRPWRLPILEYYWDLCKAIRAWDYANALTLSVSKKTPRDAQPLRGASCTRLHESAQEAFKQLLGDDLHWYIAQTYIDIVRSVLQGRITGTLPAPVREASHGLAEVFCITDPCRKDNPIILASQAFTRHSGCNMDYILGRNCRFMQGPGTTVDSCRRFAISIQERRDHSEIFVNYRRDGSPFLSMVMNAQLLDSSGGIRYYLGAQVDVSGLLKNCSGLESLVRLVDQERSQAPSKPDQHDGKPSSTLKSLSEMLSGEELDIIGNNGGLLKKKDYQHELQNTASSKADGPARVLLADGSDESDQGESEAEGSAPQPVAPENVPIQEVLTELNLRGVYKHYLLIRPAPSLRILFASPTLRIPGMLQSQFLHHIGGPRKRNDLEIALQEPKVVTAKVRWLKTVSEDGEGDGSTRWIHCTPLMHHTGQVGLWMVVIVKPNDDDLSVSSKVLRSAGARLASRASLEMDQKWQDRSQTKYGPRRFDAV